MQETATKTAGNTAETEDALQLVGFTVAGELFGVDILMVQEIIKDIPITPIPDSSEFIEGVINLRGNIIPIIDLRRRLKLDNSPQTGNKEVWMVVLNVNERVTGFIVDRVTRVIKVPAGAIKPPPDMVVAGLKSDYINGVCKLDDRLLAILDFNRVLVADEFKKIAVLKRQKAR